MIQELKNIVGAEHVFDDQATLERYSSDASLTPPKKPAAVARPASTAEVQQLVQFANRTLTPLVPASSGVHFWGASLPTQGGELVDMVRLLKGHARKCVAL